MQRQKWTALLCAVTVGFAAAGCVARAQDGNPASATVIPFTVERGAIVVTAITNGKPARLNVDTGSTQRGYRRERERDRRGGGGFVQRKGRR